MTVIRYLSSSLLEIGDQIISIFLLLETTERHLGSGNVFLGIL